MMQYLVILPAISPAQIASAADVALYFPSPSARTEAAGSRFRHQGARPACSRRAAFAITTSPAHDSRRVTRQQCAQVSLRAARRHDAPPALFFMRAARRAMRPEHTFTPPLPPRKMRLRANIFKLKGQIERYLAAHTMPDALTLVPVAWPILSKASLGHAIADGVDAAGVILPRSYRHIFAARRDDAQAAASPRYFGLLQSRCCLPTYRRILPDDAT